MKEAAKAEPRSQSDVREADERASSSSVQGVISNNTSLARHDSHASSSKATPATRQRLSYKKNKNSSGSSRTVSDTDQGAMEKYKMLNEKRPSITEAELTPIVLTQLHHTKKHKDEQRKARRGSHPKPEPQPGK